MAEKNEMPDQTALHQTALPRPAGRGIRVALALSLALNLALAGLLAGGMVRSHMGREGPIDGLGPLARALSPDDRKALREGFKQSGHDWKVFKKTARQDLETLAGLIAAEPFDRAAVEAVLARQSDAVAERVRQSQRLLLDRIASLSPGERAAFAERLLSAMKHRD